MNKKGFTLIELLAVIVILAIIALIATPIVLNIISDSKENAQIQSAEFYLDSVEYSIANSILDNNSMKDGKYTVLENGNLCLEYDENKKCLNERNIELDGEKPQGGYVIISKGQIKESRISYKSNSVRYLQDGSMFISTHEIGDEVVFNPGDRDRSWNVINETNDTLMLMLTKNLNSKVKWYSSRDNSNGPKDVLDYLNGATTGWSNVDPIKNYSYVNNLSGTEKTNGYQKIEIINGITTIIDKDSSPTTLTESSKARILTIEEVLQIASRTNRNLTKENLKEYIIRNLSSINASLDISAKNVDGVVEKFITQADYVWLQKESEYVKLYFIVFFMTSSKNIETTNDIKFPAYLYQTLDAQDTQGYWTLSSRAHNTTGVWGVNFAGGMYGFYADDTIGVRPVITISKTKLK